ncbi:MAG: TlpA family protein disulfide reductase [Kiritimatiellae bacterium]|nr:TlpA family protein disulfide reductase [Kiritimatiellia bacterium]
MNNNLTMRLFVVAVGLTFVSASGAFSDSPPARTNMDGINLADTTEDPDYAAAGEGLVRENTGDAIGDPAPLMRVTTIDGETIDFGNLYGKKPVYLKFWATWCIPCRQQMPSFQKTYERLGDDVQFVAVNLGLADDERSVQIMREKYGLTMPITIDKDGRLARLFHVVATPQHILVGRDGRFAYFGHADNEPLEAALTAAIEQTNIETVAAAMPEDVKTYAVGDRPENLSVITLDGTEIAIGGKRPGRILAVNFFSSWCEWYLEDTRPMTSKACARVREAIESLADKNSVVDWVGISSGPWATEQDLRDYRETNGVTIPLALDRSGKLFEAFGVRDIPTVVLFDEDGRILRVVLPEQTDLIQAIASASDEARAL